MKTKRALHFLLYSIAALGSQLYAQETPPSAPERIGGSRYFIGKENELLIPVNVLGYVNKPGQYMVPNGTDLVSLVAYAGGFHPDAKLNKIKIVKAQTSEGQTQILEIDIKKYFDSGQRNLIPRLLPDDTVVVSGSSAATFRAILDFIGKFVVLAEIYFYVKVATQ